MARKYAQVSPRMWTGDIGRVLRGKPNLQIVALYLITGPNANMTGLYYLPLPTIAHETGIEHESVCMALRRLRELRWAFYDADREVVYLPSMAIEQVGETIAGNNNALRKGVVNQLEHYRGHEFAIDFITRYGEAYGIVGIHEAPLKGPRGSLTGASRLLESVPGPSLPGDRTRSLFDSLPPGDQDQDQEPDQEPGQEQQPAREPARSNEDAIPVLNGTTLQQLFGRVRSRMVGGFDWQGVRVSGGKSTDMAEMINSDPSAAADVEPTMVLLFKNAQAGKYSRSAEMIENPSFAFGAWVANWTALREQLHGKQPAIPPAAKPREAVPFAVAAEQSRSDRVAQAVEEEFIESLQAKEPSGPSPRELFEQKRAKGGAA